MNAKELVKRELLQWMTYGLGYEEAKQELMFSYEETVFDYLENNNQKEADFWMEAIRELKKL